MTINNIKLETLMDNSQGFAPIQFIPGNPVNEVFWKVSGEVNGRWVFYTTKDEPTLVEEIKQELLWVYEMVTRG